MKIKKGDKVVVTTGKDKGTQGKIMLVDKKNNRVIVEGANMVKKHQKAGRGGTQQGGIISKEAPIDASNVMYLHKGKPTRIGHKVEKVEKNGKTVTKKVRIAKSTGEAID